MATNLEIEFKNMLTEQEYQQLLNKFSINEEQLWTQKMCTLIRRQDS